MTKLLIGFILGLCVTALAQDEDNPALVQKRDLQMDSSYSHLRVDADGYVICSKESPK